MPSKEQSDRPESPKPLPYYQAARFGRERLAKRAYFRAQESVFRAREDVDLSVYRFLLEHVSHVVVIGETPPAELDRRLRKILAAGESTSLPEDILHLLLQRRADASQHGPWVEGHYRPGQPF